MVSLITRTTGQQWCDCLDRYTSPPPFPPPLGLIDRSIRPAHLGAVGTLETVPRPGPPRFHGAHGACRCHYGRVREEGGRQTFKSTPPQSNYRPGHGDAHALFMADAACLVHVRRWDSHTPGRRYPGPSAGREAAVRVIGVDNSMTLW